LPPTWPASRPFQPANLDQLLASANSVAGDAVDLLYLGGHRWAGRRRGAANCQLAGRLAAAALAGAAGVRPNMSPLAILAYLTLPVVVVYCVDFF